MAKAIWGMKISQAKRMKDIDRENARLKKALAEPAQFCKVMAETKPRLAMGYHFFNDFDTAPSVL